MEISLAGLMGAAIGLVVGWFDYRLVAGILEGALRRTDRSTTPAEKARYERRIGLARSLLLVATLGFFVVLGYVAGRWLGG